MRRRLKILLFANTDWYLFNFRKSLAVALRDQGHDVVLLSPPGRYGQKLQELGFRWISAPMDRRSLNPLREGILLLWLTRLLAREDVDLVHGFTIKCAVYGSLAARLAGVAARVNAVAGMGYVYTSQQWKARLLRPIVTAIMRLALGGRGSRLIVQNPEDFAHFASSGLVDPYRVRLIPGSGVDCERFRPSLASPALGVNRRTRVLLVGRLLWDKGIGEFVAAARHLLAEGHPIDFLLAGDPDPGNPAAVPVSAVTGWSEEGVIQWLGHVDDMPTLFASVDVVTLPSYREGLPKGLIEAAACGLPLVACDAPGCRSVVIHGANGLLVPPRDALSLARAIGQLHDSPALRRQFGKAARAKALAEFDERIIIDSTVDVYAELLPATRGARAA